MDLQASYEAVRITAGVYRRSGRTLRVGGRQRMEFVQALLDTDLSTAAADVCVESAVVSDQGRPLGLAVVLIGDDQVDLVVEAPSEWFDAVVTASSHYDVTLGEDGATPVQVEGPRAWTVVADIGRRDIRHLGQRECVAAQVDGTPALLARTGTTGEHGYLVLMSDDTGLATLAARAEKVGGGLIDPAVLPRVWLESGHPAQTGQSGVLSQVRPGAQEWIGAALTATPVSTTTDPADSLVVEPPQALDLVAHHCVPVFFKDVDCPPVGSLAVVDGKVIGWVVVQTPRAGQPDGLGLVMLDERHTGIGTDIQVGSVAGRVVTQPLIGLLSHIEEVGAEPVLDPPASCCADPSVGWQLV